MKYFMLRKDFDRNSEGADL